MDAKQIRQLDRFNREIVFINENSADFPAESPSGKVKTALDAVAAEIDNLAGEQISSERRERMSGAAGDDALDELYGLMRRG